ncbi:glucose-6-phosphate dehydrogenase [Metabacillus halosaccharovorans]|uniref:glucose-6-phosphate dehydrogenase n=1 Tax=Metabacillus halosaccharovorans TaxID=930124 RepID=UPI0034CDF670
MNLQHITKSIIVIFGATGDLAKRKLFPSLFNLYKSGRLTPEGFAVVGLARRDWKDDTLRDVVKHSIDDSENEEIINEFCSHFYYQPFDITEDQSYIMLNELLERLEYNYSIPGNRLFYMSVSPQFFGEIASSLKEYKLTQSNGWKRVIIEKPFGRNASTAEQLNDEIRQAFSEDEIYRIDHYLGKEMVQNIEVIRFANSIFEPLWNNQFIANVQITLSETLGVEDRGGYYDKSGAMRDMVQNHVMQIVSLLAMEPPIRLTPEEIREEKVKVLKALKPISRNEISDYFIRAQYSPGWIDGEEVTGYRSEKNVSPNTKTETYVAGKLLIENHRWKGVPFYLRTGKRMSSKSTKVVIEFKDLPLNLYSNVERKRVSNLLIINIQPDEGITIILNGKKMDIASKTKPVSLEYSNKIGSISNKPEAYERLIYSCIIGVATNFAHSDEVMLSWNYVDLILSAWENNETPLFEYQAGSMGPKAAEKMLAKEGFCWWPI